MKKTPDFDAAAQFLAARARVVDRRLFERLFSGGGAGPVTDAVGAYRNDDGGFGYALEPDLRAAASRPRWRWRCGSWTWLTRGTNGWSPAPSTGW
jgi:hypothetical protein